MAAANLLALIDDIATLLDDVALMTKVAAKKTAGVLGDDLALNAEQVSGVKADRELPVVGAVAKGSLLNKAILVPAAMAISAWVPALITPLLMVGGAYLCFEGFEKLWHRITHSAHAAEDEAHHASLLAAVENPAIDLVAMERDKIRGAIRTDFILSAEIIAITLGSVAGQPLVTQLGVLVTVAVVLTIGVYGLVAAIVKMDDAGLALSRIEGDGGLRPALRAFGRLLLGAAPWLMKFLALAGTVAMFLVGGSILVHGAPPLHHAIETITAALPGWLHAIGGMVADLGVGLVAGALVLAGVSLVQKLRGKN
ncbi:DUF808 domain-containing protein [Ideonella azotifigens]|uniref:DUF808 domain-containing protein n=1 Tax=Ideonella azotifigens TaxID=513160 RepID=A0ABP3VLD0_9BURK|nr:DUF808 domain-containing protein [Ideonella azotifigens]MCD2343734.1 DUF808 domain-containing protein [Ideonella azotifigens]